MSEANPGRAGGSAASVPRLPNLIVAGVSKAGTTSLFEYLGQHPEVCLSDIKELKYFIPLMQGAALGPLEDYARHFAHCGSRYAIEATPAYFYGGSLLARTLDETLPDAKVIVSLRSPIDRCWSWFRFVKSRVTVPQEMSFEEYLDRCEELRRQGQDGAYEHRAYWGLRGGCYDEWLEAWVTQFGARLKVLYFEDLAVDPARTIRDVCGWLEIDEGVVEGFDFPVQNKTEQFRIAPLQQFAVAINRRGERFFRRHRDVKRRLRSAYYAVNRQPSRETISPQTLSRLADYYRPHNANLAIQLTSAGIALPPWLEPS